MASASTLAFVANAKYCDGLPLYRIEQMFERTQYNWQFMYLGADVSAFSDAASLGIPAAARDSADAPGVRRLYAASSESVAECRRRVARGERAELEVDPELESK